MSTEVYLTEIRDQLRIYFLGIKNGQDPALPTKYQLEGFMRAGVILGITSNADLQKMMEEIHQQVFNESIEGRKLRKSGRYSELNVNYAQYESPAISRVKIK